MNRYIILASYLRAPPEKIDTAQDEETAKYLVEEYQLAYGGGWKITYEDKAK